ncbi:DUF5677 domain-containing protein [Dokdonella immobilis]|uniref:Uncharacterized protein n=1 Tax=Dokdonella immobilis TaxID=578942 RepID=A0A1I4ZP62_9GAMM|nr:DUF5677 domain-containing protein [Dokdonella immobilis]SFN52012.1 hypothetical protein SAMN05216289_12754 [Dokdonella immobilis]
MLPVSPDISEELRRECEASGDFRPIYFEWYKYVGLLCNFFASVRADSPGVIDLPATHYAVLIGLLNRCSRLMLANTALGNAGRFGESTAIIDRCIFESGVKLRWLCRQANQEAFTRFLLDGLRPEVEFKAVISENARQRGALIAIERRMLDSIDRYMASVEADDATVLASQRLPDLASMITAIGEDRLLYVIGQRIGSHHVHGTWVSLRRDYLEEYDGVLGPKDHVSETHESQFLLTSILVLETMKAFVSFAFRPDPMKDELLSVVDAVSEEVRGINPNARERDEAADGEI